MSKIICEICGTVYPDNAVTCPICGCQRGVSGDADIPQEQAVAAGAARATQRVKGGRFSNKNVKKRNQESNSGAPRMAPPKRDKKNDDEQKSNRGLVITALVLLAIVLLLAVYIGFRFLGGTTKRDNSKYLSDSTNSTSTSESQQEQVACTDLTISGFAQKRGLLEVVEGKPGILTVKADPVGTTDAITCSVEPDGVASVEASGEKITVNYLKSGNATVTVTCGDVSETFEVVCKEPEPTETTTEPTETTETEPTETTEAQESGKLSLSHSDFTMFAEGETVTIAPGKGISPVQCNWISKDESVVTVVNGKVTAVGPGMTTILVEFEGQEQTCIVRCSWVEETDTTDPTDETDETDPTDETEPSESDGGDEETYEISRSDVTIRVGESFDLKLINSNGETVDVSWTTYPWLNGGDVSVSGNTITGDVSGECTVSCTYNGVEYKCVVHIQ